MPSRPDPALEQHAELAAVLRAAKPRPSEELRERVRSLTLVPQPEPEPARRRFRLRRPGLVLVPLVAALGIAAGIFGLSSDGEREAGRGAAASEEAAVTGAPRTPPRSALITPSDDAATLESAAAQPGVAPTPGRRLTEYRAELRVRVDDLNELGGATQRAMRIARSLGGYVVSARLESPPGQEGDSILVVRVPVGRVQEAIAGFTGLGSLVSQRISLEDLQQQVNRRNETIDRLRGSIADLERALAAPGLTAEEEAQLRRQLAATRAELNRQLKAQEQTVRRGRLARIALTLTTRSAEESAPPTPPGDFEQTLRDAVGALGEIVSWFLYVLIVAAPFAALAAAGVWLERIRRRRSDERLLARS